MGPMQGPQEDVLEDNEALRLANLTRSQKRKRKVGLCLVHPNATSNCKLLCPLWTTPGLLQESPTNLMKDTACMAAEGVS